MKICADYFATTSTSGTFRLFALTSPCFKIGYTQLNWCSQTATAQAQISPGNTLIVGFDYSRHGMFAEAINIECEIFNEMPIKFWDIYNNNNTVITTNSMNSSLVLFCEFYPL